MANRAYLLTVDDSNITWSKDPEREILAEGINEIPIFWASLFDASNRTVDTFDTNVRVPNWCVDSDTGKRRVEGLHDAIAMFLDAEGANVWDQWVSTILAQETDYFKTNAFEIWCLDNEYYEEYWRVLLGAFTNPSETNFNAGLIANDLLATDSVLCWDEPEETVCKLAGAEHIRNLSWIRFPSKRSETVEEPSSVWDQLKKFEKQSGLPYGAANLVMVACNERMLERPFSLDEMLLAILDYYKQIGLNSKEMVDDLCDNGLKASNDVVRALMGLKEIGSPITLRVGSNSAVTKSIVKQLFPEQDVADC